MHRNELKYSNEQLIDFVRQGFAINVEKLNYIETGSFFAFSVLADDRIKYFLKIYPRYQLLSPVVQITAELLNNIGHALHSFSCDFGLQSILRCIPTKTSQFCFVIKDLLFILFDYVEGKHPTYNPNQLMASKLAQLLLSLHQIPTAKFSYLPREDFDIRYAMGLALWLNRLSVSCRTSICEKMINKLKRHHNGLKMTYYTCKKGKLTFASKVRLLQILLMVMLITII